LRYPVFWLPAKPSHRKLSRERQARLAAVAMVGNLLCFCLPSAVSPLHSYYILSSILPPNIFPVAQVCLNESKTPFFASKKKAEPSPDDGLNEIEKQAREEAKEETIKSKKISNLRNANG
jgi:hypothetical protein